MFELSAAEITLLEQTMHRYEILLADAEELRQARLALILEAHGVPGDTVGRFSRSGPSTVVFLPAEAPEADVPPAPPPEDA